jgi:hypothetical protein
MFSRNTLALRGAVSRDHPGSADHHLGTRVAQARGFDVGPSLLRAVVADLMDVEPVTLGQRRRHAGFDLRGKSGENGEGGSDKRSDRDG